MNAVERTRYYSASYLLRFLALLCFIATECVAQGWLTKGTVWEWFAAGAVLYVAAEFAP